MGVSEGDLVGLGVTPPTGDRVGGLETGSWLGRTVGLDVGGLVSGVNVGGGDDGRFVGLVVVGLFVGLDVPQFSRSTRKR